MSLSYKVPVHTDNSQPVKNNLLHLKKKVGVCHSILQKIMERFKGILHKAGLTYMPISSTGIWHKV